MSKLETPAPTAAAPYALVMCGAHTKERGDHTPLHNFQGICLSLMGENYRDGQLKFVLEGLSSDFQSLKTCAQPKIQL